MSYGPRAYAEYQDGTSLLLAEPAPEHMDAVIPVEDPEVTRYLHPAVQENLTQADHVAFKSATLEHEELTNWGVYINPSAQAHQLAGFCGFHEDTSFYVFMLAPNSRRRGFGTKAARLMMGVVFTLNPELEECTTYIHRDNVASRAMATRLGMTQLPASESSLKDNDKYVKKRPEQREGKGLFATVWGLGETSLTYADIMTS